MLASARIAPLWLIGCLALATASCEGSGDGQGGSAGAGASSGGSGASSSGGQGGAQGGSGGSGGAQGGSGGSGASSSGGQGGAGGATSSTSGTGGNPGGPSVACGDLNCPLPAQNCCKNYNEPAACIAPGGDCTYGVPLACDGPEDCNTGEVCCAKLYTKGVGNAYEYTSCTTTCAGKDFRVVCGASGDCPQGETCGPSDILPPYLDCK